MAGADLSQRQGAREKRRNLRSRLACARCQRRKIRCDGNVPGCENCKKASAECIDGESVRLGDFPRAQISRLRQRVSWLESIVRERCPDVDLSEGEGEDESNFTLANDTNLGAPIPASRQSTNPRPQEQTFGLLSHEIGLVSLNSSENPRYIGPSSGYFLARVMLASSRREEDGWRTRNPAAAQPLNDLVEALQGPLPLPPEAQARLLCDQYFEVIHAQFPILHRPTFLAKLQQVLTTTTPEPEDAFQVFMVLALGSIIASHRRRVRLPAESYCLSALRYFDSINVENSIQGLQCLLLLFIFTIHCSNMKLNVWYLNYQCIAAVLDLGLQRKITTRSGITLLEQEMRTRLFWVVMMLDRRIATMMGRPIGLRDEACDLRLPQNIDDEALCADIIPSETETSMSFSVHLFQLAKLNSEIKYVAMSINRATPRYAYPTVVDYHDWQRTTLARLDEWAANIPIQQPDNLYIHTICRIQYCSLKMVLLRPNPAIPKPPRESLRQCHDAAAQNLRLISQLYKSNLLIHSWETFYSLVLSAITRLYCIKAVSDLAKDTDAGSLAADLGEALSILSATGEHFPGAKRCRDILDDLGRSLVRWLKESNQTDSTREAMGDTMPQDPQLSNFGSSWNDNELPSTSLAPPPESSQVMMPVEDVSSLPFFAQEPFDPLGSSTWDTLQADSDNMDAIIRSLFDDFIPNSGDCL